MHRSEEHTSELQSPCNLVCRLLLEKKKHSRRTRPLRSPTPGGSPCARCTLVAGREGLSVWRPAVTQSGSRGRYSSSFFFLMIRPPPTSPLFPHTTFFR